VVVTARRITLHMKPGCGPTIEGLLIKRTRREYVLIKAELLEDTERTHDMGGHVTVLRENVFCIQEMQ
jgi:hypothetical protein